MWCCWIVVKCNADGWTRHKRANPGTRGQLLSGAGLRRSEIVTIQRADVDMMTGAILGGYQNRSCDGPPGWITLWRGYQRLMALLEGDLLARAAPPG